MAGFVNRKKCDDNTKLCNIAFDNGVNSGVRATLIKELMKYILYERGQIPRPFDQIQTAKSPHNSRPNDGNDSQTVSVSYKRKCFYDGAEKKKQSLVTDFTNIFQRLDHVFDVYPELSKVLILLGGTVISPKEHFLVNLPPQCPESETITHKTCKQSLLRQLIVQDVLGGVKPISPTSMIVMVYAKRDAGIEWFIPKPNFRIPARGRRFVYNVSCGDRQQEVHDVCCESVSEAEISGIEPFESSVISDSDMSQGEESSTDQETTSESSGSSSLQSSQDCTIIECNSVLDLCTANIISSGIVESDTIWYQSPLSAKGYKESMSLKL